MNLNWNLESIYPSFNSEAFKSDYSEIESLIEELTHFTKALTPEQPVVESLETAVRKFSRLYELISTVAGYASLKFTVNTSDAEAIGYYEKAEKLITEITQPDVSFKRYLNTLGPLELHIEKSELLKEHRFYLNYTKQCAAHMLSDNEEILIAKLMTTGSSSWSMLQSKLTSKLSVDVVVNGETKQVTLSEARAMAHEADLSVRKAAYEGELAAYPQIEEAVASALNSIKGEVLTTSERRHHESPLSEALFKTKMSQQTLDALLGAIQDNLPKMRSYYKRKGELLGDTNGIKFYNLFAPVGNSTKTFTFEEGMAFVIENFNAFSKDMGDYANRTLVERWIDVEPKAGKVGGAFCYPIKKLEESRILLNYKGSLGDVITTAHELGHGWHNESLKGASSLNVNMPMPLAETASTFCETIVGKAALKTISPEEEITVLENSLQDAGQCIVDIYSRFLFESRLFEKRKDGSVSVDELKNIMLGAQQDAYGEGLDPEVRHPYMWLNKGHYYSADLNFYNFPYAFGLLFAKGLYNIYLQEGDSFLPKYNQLLAFTGQETIENVCASVGLDVTDKAFWMGSLSIIGEDVDRFIELSHSL